MNDHYLRIQSVIVIGTPTLLRGGTEMQTLFLVRALQALNYRIVVCCYHEHDESVVNAYRKTGVDVMPLSYERVTSPASALQFMMKLASVFRSLKPYCIHLQYIAPGFLATCGAKLSGCKRVIVSIHYPATIYGWKEKALLRLSSLMSRFTIANSLATEQSWFGSSQLIDSKSILLNDHHGTIYNCVDSKNIQQNMSTFSSADMRAQMQLSNVFVVTIIGRLSAEKGHVTILKAIQRLVQNHQAVLLIVGDGQMRDSLCALATKLGIESNIRWCGSVAQEEVFRLLSVSDVVVVPSRYEGFSLAAAEAMAAGVPVIASTTGGLPEVVEHERTGLLVPPGNVEALADAIQLLADNPEMRVMFGKAGRQRVESVFSVELYQASIRAVYDQLMKGKTDT